MNQRLLSLDVFRGMTVALMILVNNPGDWGHIYAPLEHAEWHGCTPTDLVFPFFLFIVGMAIPFAMAVVKDSEGVVIRKIAVRSLKMFGLGLFLSLFPKLDLLDVRIPGVLQRIALVYFVCSLLFLKTSQRSLIWTAVVLLIAYWVCMSFVPVPDAGAPNLEAATNLGAWIDRLILTKKHLYLDGPFDPEGIFSTIPAIATGISGMLAGIWIRRNDKNPSEKMVGLFVYGLLAMTLGWAWDAAGFPINKALWTSSYVCWTSGLALCFFAMFYWVIDVRQIHWWTRPFMVYGVNAITVFFLSGLLVRIMSQLKVPSSVDSHPVRIYSWLYEWGIEPLFSNPKNASLAGAIIFLTIWYIILEFMYQKKFIVKV
jgi:predicted acyltransferase